MFKSVEIIVPKETTENTPQQTVVKLCKGTLKSITIRPAPGPRWELYVKVRYREFSIFPINDDQWVPLEEHPVRIEPNWNNWDGTYDITIECCSPQARYPHTILVDIEIEEQYTLYQLLFEFIKRGL